MPDWLEWPVRAHNHARVFLALEVNARPMKTKMLTPQEVKERVTKTISEVVSKLFNSSNELTTKKLRSSLSKLMQDEQSLLKATLVHEMKGLVKSGVKGKGRPCTEEELEVVLTQIRALAPEMASAFRRELKNLQRGLPRRGGPGRDEILNIAEKREVCEQVGSLHKMGQIKKMSDVFETVADTFRKRGKKISARTVQRAWQKREALYKG